ncbi:MAG: magnesium and cobalt transport protein CorA [Candidatus Fluviicola riflensis]|nr:MAG: magnesium and cobalt transport protein CorA [Candidatus Fluviicola riflensis]OGS79239.1 MAG: magnesium and cobalt transport protein CorA [Candidatus Fluviicola riflensis]OGS86671.1 MAG: magnesium and cobalt transport protein CorA [Fluviicola sp. RIFCSPHIGHO2_01_FULL_43_53]OGS88855.1 MAG: magnesium and cobalt transport protein CorA [Fluviicola sp. RIFCSPHIGHO2_12_FULL_43_24]
MFKLALNLKILSEMQQKPVQHYRYNADVLTVTKEDVGYFLTHFQPENEPGLMHWLNFHSMEDKEAITRFCEKLSIDKLIQEDLFKGTKRPRLEEYEGYIFFSITSALPSRENDFELRKERISFILGKNYLVSFQERVSDHFPEVRERLEMKRGKIRVQGPDFLLFRMLEAITDNYTEVVEEISSIIVTLESLVIRLPRSEVLRRIEWQKRKLGELRKIIHPIRELVGQIDRAENHFFSEENDHYFLDLKDNCIVLIEEIEEQKQILDGLTNLYYATQGQKMNEIMKVLTVISAVFIPLTFIVGVYGMNFKYMPELNWRYGYFYAIGFMFILASSLIFVFYKRGWLRRNK